MTETRILGQVFGWGIFRDSSGRFGFAPGVGVQETPKEVPMSEKITQIASGTQALNPRPTS